MLSRRVFQLWAVALTVAFSALTLWAAKEFVMPHAENASTYPCKDAHPTEKVTMAVEVYNTSPKADIFITPYNQESILPLFLIITNDGNQPVTVKGMQAELVTAQRSKLESLTADDVFRRVAHVDGSSTSPARVGPIPLGGNKNKKVQKQYEEIMNSIFTAAAVEPHTTRSGFLFFDVRDVKQPVEGAHVYLTGVRDSNGNELMYFEVPLVPSNAASGSGQ